VVGVLRRAAEGRARGRDAAEGEGVVTVKANAKMRSDTRKQIKGQRLSPNEQVYRALSIIGPLVIIGPAGEVDKPSKLEFRSKIFAPSHPKYGDAKKKVEAALRDAIKDALLRIHDPWLGLNRGIRNKRLKSAQNTIKRLRVAVPEITFDEKLRELNAIAAELMERGGRPKPSADKQRQAAIEAVELLRHWSTRKIAAKFGGYGDHLPKLASVLYGYPRADLQRHCWETLKRQKAERMLIGPDDLHPVWLKVLAGRYGQSAMRTKKPGPK
jgi:hypothetical protein